MFLEIRIRGLLLLLLLTKTFGLNDNLFKDIKSLGICKFEEFLEFGSDVTGEDSQTDPLCWMLCDFKGQILKNKNTILEASKTKWYLSAWVLRSSCFSYQ